MSNTLSIDEQKKRVAQTAIDTLIGEKLIHSNMKIGLGTGSTAMPAVKRLADYIANGTLQNIAAVPTSFQTSIACEELGIPIFSLSSGKINGRVELTIDGADEIDPKKNEDKVAFANMDYYALMPGVFYADLTIVQSKEMRKAYLMKISEFMNKEIRKKMTKKISGAGSCLFGDKEGKGIKEVVAEFRRFLLKV